MILHHLYAAINLSQKKQKEERKEVKEYKTKKATMVFPSIPIYADPSNWNEVYICRRICNFPPIFLFVSPIIYFISFFFPFIFTKEKTKPKEQLTKENFNYLLFLWPSLGL
jgi:hypothetical protein